MSERRNEQLEEKSYEGVEKRDPSANVLLLVHNASKYLEDLHKQSECFYDQKLTLYQDFLNQKLQLAVEVSQRERKVESQRIDATREDDRKAIEVANERAIKQAELLAKQMIENNEALRSAMAEQAKQNASMVQQVTSSLDARLKIVETNQYMLAGTTKGGRDMWGWVIGGVSFVILVVKFIIDYTH